MVYSDSTLGGTKLYLVNTDDYNKFLGEEGLDMLINLWYSDSTLGGTK